MELSKKDKKVAREIIEKGLQNEFASGLTIFQAILSNWKEGKMDNRETYHALYRRITSFDKHISRRYDGMTGSKYLFIIAGQLLDNAILDADLENFSEEAKKAVKSMANL